MGESFFNVYVLKKKYMIEKFIFAKKLDFKIRFKWHLANKN